jgi:hypothetical protein
MTLCLTHETVFQADDVPMCYSFENIDLAFKAFQELGGKLLAADGFDRYQGIRLLGIGHWEAGRYTDCARK